MFTDSPRLCTRLRALSRRVYQSAKKKEWVLPIEPRTRLDLVCLLVSIPLAPAGRGLKCGKLVELRFVLRGVVAEVLFNTLEYATKAAFGIELLADVFHRVDLACVLAALPDLDRGSSDLPLDLDEALVAAV